LETPGKEIEFDVIKENWTKYQLRDDTVLRVRIAVLKVVEEGIGEVGFPNFRVATHNLLSALVPDKLKGPPSSDQKLTPTDIQEGTELTFDRMGTVQWQEYSLSTGWILMIKPEVAKVIRTKKYNNEREPIYWANIQAIMNVKKA